MLNRLENFYNEENDTFVINYI